MNFAHKFRRWNFNGLVGAEISCKNGRDIRCRGEDRAAFPLVATSREKAASRLRGRPPPVLFLGRKVAYPTSPQNLGANVFSPSPSRAAAICREGSFGDMSGLEKRRYLTLRQNWAYSCRAQSCGLGWLKTEIQTHPLPKAAPNNYRSDRVSGDPSVIARSPCDEAIQGPQHARRATQTVVLRPLDCFASLAMTDMGIG